MFITPPASTAGDLFLIHPQAPIGWQGRGSGLASLEQEALVSEDLPKPNPGEESSISAGSPGHGSYQSLLLLHVATIVLAPHDFELDTREVLGAAALHEDHVVLLQAVALARNEADGFTASAEPHAAALAVGRVGLLGLASERAQDHALQLRAALCGARTLGLPFGGPQAMHLVQGSHGAGGPELGNQGHVWRDTTGRVQGSYYSGAQIIAFVTQFWCSRHGSKNFKGQICLYPRVFLDNNC